MLPRACDASMCDKLLSVGKLCVLALEFIGGSL